jgi:hypothetical protein
MKASLVTDSIRHKVKAAGLELALFPDEHLEERRMFPDREDIKAMYEYSRVHPEILKAT